MISRVFTALVGLGLVAAAWAGTSHRHNLTGESIGLLGYDPVSYFTEGGSSPLKGLIGITTVRDGVTYRFVSQENLSRFEKNPDHYLPAYGGWCAFAVAELGKRVDIDPQSFVVRDGKLYVFYRDPQLDTRALWLKDPARFIVKGDTRWPELAR